MRGYFEWLSKVLIQRRVEKVARGARSKRQLAGLSGGEQRKARLKSQLPPTSHIPMLSYAVIFLIIAILAGVLGFGVIAGTAAMVAKVCFVVFLILFLFSLFSGRGKKL